MLAAPDGYGSCPACTAPVFAKCGEHVQWHWAHAVGEGVDCELGEGLDADEYTGWHIAVQTHANGLGATIEATHPTKKRRADIRTAGGRIIELQHSRIDRDVVLGREADWTPLGPMLWLWDAADWDRDDDDVPGNRIIVGTTPIFLDCGDQIQQITAIEEQRGQRRLSLRCANLGIDVYEFVGRLIDGSAPRAWDKAPTVFRPDRRKLRAANIPTETIYCSAPSFAGTFSGERCGLTATDDTDLCWAHLATQQAERAAS
jgi:hypothetical protein